MTQNETEALFRCPNGHIGRIDAEQEAGDVSIICNSCEFHGYVDGGEVVRSLQTETDRE